MRRTVLMLIVCLVCVGSASAVYWGITEIPVPDTNSVDYLSTWTIDDYGHLYWVHDFFDCDADGANCTPRTHTLYRYDWTTDSVSTIAQPPQGIRPSFNNAYTSSSGINVAWTQTDGIRGGDIFFYDGDEVTQVTDTPGVTEKFLLFPATAFTIPV